MICAHIQKYSYCYLAFCNLLYLQSCVTQSKGGNYSYFNCWNKKMWIVGMKICATCLVNTIIDKGKDRKGGNKEKMRKVERESLAISSPFPHSLSISSSVSHNLSIFSFFLSFCETWPTPTMQCKSDAWDQIWIEDYFLDILRFFGCKRNWK